MRLFTATGGCYVGYGACASTRDLFNDPARGMASGVNASALFPPLRAILAAGLKPHLVTGSVPIALSLQPPVLGGFGFNSQPPADMAEYRRYIAQVAAQLAAEFSLAEVATWRWGVFTEYNNPDWLRSNASVFADVFDYTACGLVDGLGAPAAVDLGVHACTQCRGGGAWDALAFLQHAASGTSACSGQRPHLNWTGNSFYESAPGAPGDLSWFAPQALPVLQAARALGLPARRFGIDEGRLLYGPEGPAYALTTRAVGAAYQGSWDALLFKLLAGTGAPEAYYSRWGLGFQPDVFADPAGSADSVATNVARLTYALAGLPRVPTANASAGGGGGGGGACSASSIVDGVVALDSSARGGGGGGWRVLALLFHHHPWLNASDAGSGCSGAAVRVALCGAPAASAGRAVPGATATRVGAAAANAWPAWAAAAAAANLSHASGDYRAGWSAASDCPPLASARALAALARALPGMQAAAALAAAPLAGGAAVGADACLRFDVALAPHEVALVELALPA